VKLILFIVYYKIFILKNLLPCNNDDFIYINYYVILVDFSNEEPIPNFCMLTVSFCTRNFFKNQAVAQKRNKVYYQMHLNCLIFSVRLVVK